MLKCPIDSIALQQPIAHFHSLSGHSRPLATLTWRWAHHKTELNQSDIRCTVQRTVQQKSSCTIYWLWTAVTSCHTCCYQCALCQLKPDAQHTSHTAHCSRASLQYKYMFFAPSLQHTPDTTSATMKKESLLFRNVETDQHCTLYRPKTQEQFEQELQRQHEKQKYFFNVMIFAVADIVLYCTVP